MGSDLLGWLGGGCRWGCMDEWLIFYVRPQKKQKSKKKTKFHKEKKIKKKEMIIICSIEVSSSKEACFET